VSLELVPVTLTEAKAFVGAEHRHHAPPVGHRWSIGAGADGKLVGVVVVGRPVARMADDGLTAEVTRLATDGTKNACSLLYSAAARAATAMGYRRIQTYILASEPGTSLRAAGWTCEGPTGGGQWKHREAPSDLWGDTRRTDQPTEAKMRWAKTLRGVT
jgi:hypothetical protein